MKTINTSQDVSIAMYSSTCNMAHIECVLWADRNKNAAVMEIHLRECRPQLQKKCYFLIELFFTHKFPPHNLSIPHLDREGRRTLHDEGVAEVVSALS